MQRVLQVREPWFTLIREGRKTIEGRRGRLEDFQHIKSIEFQCNEESVIVNVHGLRHYVDLREMLLAEPLEQLLPGVSSEQKALDIYHGFWSDDFVAASGGMVALDVAVCDPNKRSRLT